MSPYIVRRVPRNCCYHHHLKDNDEQVEEEEDEKQKTVMEFVYPQGDDFV